MSRYDSVSDEQCSHCHARLGAGRGRCWWCLQAYGDAQRTAMVDEYLSLENAAAFAPQWLASYVRGGLFYLPHS